MRKDHGILYFLPNSCKRKLGVIEEQKEAGKIFCIFSKEKLPSKPRTVLPFGPPLPDVPLQAEGICKVGKSRFNIFKQHIVLLKFSDNTLNMFFFNLQVPKSKARGPNINMKKCCNYSISVSILLDTAVHLFSFFIQLNNNTLL